MAPCWAHRPQTRARRLGPELPGPPGPAPPTLAPLRFRLDMGQNSSGYGPWKPLWFTRGLPKRSPRSQMEMDNLEMGREAGVCFLMDCKQTHLEFKGNQWGSACFEHTQVRVVQRFVGPFDVR